MSAAADKYDQEAASHRAQVRIAEETEARLQADPAAQAWLKQFAYDGEPFLEGYLEQKIQYLEFGAKYAAHYEAMALKPQERAYRRLWEIQQKKLFNLQCEWRAGRLEIEGIATAADFTRWGQYIHECPLIEPVAEDEVDLYLAYIASDDCVDITDRNWERTMDWQCFLDFRRYQAAEDLADEGGPDERHRLHNRYPDWYDYCDRHRGTSYLMRLPIVNAENGYWAEPSGPPAFVKPAPVAAPVAAPAPALPPVAAASPVAAEAEAAAPAPRLPHLGIRDKAMTERLLRLVEPPEVLRYWQALENQPPNAPATAHAHEVIQQLGSVPYPVPIAPAATWQEAVYAAWVQQQKHELLGVMPAVYAEYCLREELGIAHPAPSQS